jgi:hypothetical protein
MQQHSRICQEAWSARHASVLLAATVHLCDNSNSAAFAQGSKDGLKFCSAPNATLQLSQKWLVLVANVVQVRHDNGNILVPCAATEALCFDYACTAYQTFQPPTSRIHAAMPM